MNKHQLINCIAVASFDILKSGIEIQYILGLEEKHADLNPEQSCMALYEACFIEGWKYEGPQLMVEVDVDGKNCFIAWETFALDFSFYKCAAKIICVNHELRKPDPAKVTNINMVEHARNLLFPPVLNLNSVGTF